MLNVFRIFFYSGYRRQLGVLAALLAGGLAENLGIASLWPIVSMASGDTQQSNKLVGRLVVDILAYLSLPPTLGILLGFMIFFVAVKFMFSLIGMNFVGREVANITTRIRLRLIDAIMRARWSYFTSQPSGRFTSAISIESDRAAFSFKQSGTVLAKCAECLAYLIGCLVISWQFSAAALLAAIVLWLAVTRYMRMARKAGNNKSKFGLRLATSIGEILTNIKALKAMNRHIHVAAAFDADIAKLRRVLERETYSNAAVTALQEPILAILLIGGIYLGHTFLDLQLQGLVATLWLLRRIADNIGDIRQGMQTLYIDSSAFWGTVELIKEIEAEAEHLTAGKQVSLTRSARLEHVFFAYPNREVMHDVSMEIPAGKITTIIGPSGAGKTTIADVLVGLNRPASGEAFIDDVALGSADLSRWRNQIGYIPQDNILFNDTVANNITLGDQSIPRDKIEDALKLAGAWNFVEKLPEGLDQVVGVRGNLLSGGQKQRLSIARALISDPSLLILDEATSALDHDTAREICDSVRNLAGRRTILAITHQALWIEAADRIFEMQNGSVTAVEPQTA
ncbi:MAG TPA: ABC transporter ATP-binding protein [Terriglobia bacterium]|nr:ABC transporter ATP-binding protein [Terriglobia bacterium]